MDVLLNKPLLLLVEKCKVIGHFFYCIWWLLKEPFFKNFLTTVEPWFNDLRYSDIPSITINNLLPTKQKL